jgi:hypothetical protein
MELAKLIKSEAGASGTYRDAFRARLGRRPFCLRWKTDPGLPGLFLVHATKQSDHHIQEVREANGVILDDSFNLVAHGMNKMLELPPVPFALPPDGAHTTQVAEDGTILKAFHHGGRWVWSTSRRLDAYSARWSSAKTFGQLLEESVPLAELEDQMDTGNTYSFALLHPENRLVLAHDKPQLVHVSTRVTATGAEEQGGANGESFPGLTRGPEYLSAAASLPAGKRGIIVMDLSDPRSIVRYKWDSPAYRHATALKNNERRMHMSYLAYSGEEECSLIRRAFPDQTDRFDRLDRFLAQLSRALYATYTDAFIRKHTYIGRTHPFWPLLAWCLDLRKREAVKIGRKHCRSAIAAAPATVLDRALAFLTDAYSEEFFGRP